MSCPDVLGRPVVASSDRGCTGRAIYIIHPIFVPGHDAVGSGWSGLAGGLVNSPLSLGLLGHILDRLHRA